MAERPDPFDDDLGPAPIDRGGGKVMDGGDRTSGGGAIDLSYEDALRILGRADEIPSPVAQVALTMSNPEAAELARRLTALRQAAGAGTGPLAETPTLGTSDEAAPVGQAVTDFIAALQEVPPDQQKLAALRQQIGGAGGEVQAVLERVCEYPAVRTKLGS